MFEKEAEEYIKKDGTKAEQILSLMQGKIKVKIKQIPFILAAFQLTYQDGAEFGYNKAKEEDKWHYPSKGELPKCDEETQLIFYVNCYYEVGGETFTRKRTVLGYYQKSFMNDDVKLFVEKSKGYSDEHLPRVVIAWKEIELPKEMENV